jgi:tetratricopeptide (TPR) repeat protein
MGDWDVTLFGYSNTNLETYVELDARHSAVVGGSPNFGHLFLHDAILYQQGADAEAQAHSDPNTSMVKSRQFAERLAEVLCASRGSGRGARTLRARVELLRGQEVIKDADVYDLFTNVRVTGNKAVHEYWNDKADALRLVYACYLLGAWFHRTVVKGVEPGPFVLPTSSDTTEVLPAVPRLLPARVSAFAARQTELRRLDGLLSSPARAGMVVVTAITGTAGIGKTALAMHWAHEVASRFPDGQLYVNLRGFHPVPAISPAAALFGFLRALGVTAARVPEEAEVRAALYRSLVTDRRMLIVLDNAQSAAQVRPLLPGASSCVVVVTSRSCLDELVVYQGAERINLGLLSTEEAADLLARRIDRERVDAEPQAARDLVELCARLPLALSIAAAGHHPDAPLRELVERLRGERSRLDALDLGEADLDLRAVFSWSVRQLTPDAGCLFRLLGVHPGPDVDAHVCAALLDVRSVREARAVLNELSRANLIEEHQPGRYQMHDLLRVYAAELAHYDERRRAERRIISYYHNISRLANAHLQPCWDERLYEAQTADTCPAVTTYTGAMNWFAAEQAALRSVIESIGHRESSLCLREIARGCAAYYTRSGQRHERVAVWRTVLAAARRDRNQIMQVMALRDLARAVIRLGDFDEAIGYLDEALRLNQLDGDREGEIAIQLSYARLYDLLGKHTEALRRARRAEQVEREAVNLRYRAGILTAIAKQLTCLGRSDAALPLCENGRDLYTQVNNPDGQAQALNTLGLIHQNLNNETEAIACYESALEINRHIGSRYWEATMLDRLADLYHSRNQLTRAREARLDALTILNTLHHPDAEGVQAKLVAA